MKRFLRESQKRARIIKSLFAAVPIALVIFGASLYLNRKANALKAEATAAGASQALLEIASRYYESRSDPRRNVLALSTASEAIALNKANFDAIKLACNLLLGKRWCAPLTQPLHYPASDFLSASLMQEGDQNYIFAVSHNGLLLRFSGTAVEPEVIASLVDGEQHGGLVLLAASFSHDGRELVDIQSSQAVGGVQARSWKRQGLTYVPQSKVPIQDYSNLNVLTWSSDDRVLVFLPLRFDQPSRCQAFRVDDGAAIPIVHPFGDVAVSSVAFSRDGIVATARGETLRLGNGQENHSNR